LSPIVLYVLSIYLGSTNPVMIVIVQETLLLRL